MNRNIIFFYFILTTSISIMYFFNSYFDKLQILSTIKSMPDSGTMEKLNSKLVSQFKLDSMLTTSVTQGDRLVYIFVQNSTIEINLILNSTLMSQSEHNSLFYTPLTKNLTVSYLESTLGINQNFTKLNSFSQESNFSTESIRYSVIKATLLNSFTNANTIVKDSIHDTSIVHNSTAETFLKQNYELEKLSNNYSTLRNKFTLDSNLNVEPVRQNRFWYLLKKSTNVEHYSILRMTSIQDSNFGTTMSNDSSLAKLTAQNFAFETSSKKDLNYNNKKIFCIITTSNRYLDSRAKIAYQSWVRKCNNHRFITFLRNGISKKQSYDFQYDNSFFILKPADLINDSYSKLTDKVFLAFKDIYNKFPNYDWYLKADDDTFVFMNNLNLFLENKNHNTPVTYGYDINRIVVGGYHSGGAGYLLSREAFQRLGKKLNEDYKFCPNSGLEDVDVASCLRKLGVHKNMSLDEFGRERFHALSIKRHYFGENINWLKNNLANNLQTVKF